MSSHRHATLLLANQINSNSFRKLKSLAGSDLSPYARKVEHFIARTNQLHINFLNVGFFIIDIKIRKRFLFSVKYLKILSLFVKWTFYMKPNTKSADTQIRFTPTFSKSLAR